MICARLKAATQNSHASLERRLKIANSLAPRRADYIDYLQALYGFYAPFEAQLRLGVANLPDALEAARLVKTPLLERDLKQLTKRRNLESLPCAARSQLPPTDTRSRVLGALYVLEGATLGGSVLTARLPGAVLGGATAFLECYGRERGEMWRGFRELLEAHARGSTEREQELQASARSTFQLLSDWLVGCGAAEAEP